MIFCGLTGQIGSGKSTAAGYLEDLGAKIIKADDLAKSVVEVGKPAWVELKEKFDKKYFNADETLNRKAVANLVFKNKTSLALLNSIVHKEVSAELIHRLNQINQQNSNELVVYEVPLLFELNMQNLFQATILIYAKNANIEKRIVASRGIDKELLVKIRSSQIAVSKKKAKSDFKINNDHSLAEFKLKIEKLYTRLINLQNLNFESTILAKLKKYGLTRYA